MYFTVTVSEAFYTAGTTVLSLWLRGGWGGEEKIRRKKEKEEGNEHDYGENKHSFILFTHSLEKQF